MQHQSITILGPTASGKTHLAVQLAREIGGEVLSIDSRQVYKGMDIGTGKDLEEYQEVAYHLIDIVDAGEDFHISHFQNAFENVYQKVVANHKIPILCGGSGMYLQAVLQNYQQTEIPIDLELREKLFLLPNAVLLEKVKEYSDSDLIVDVSTHKRLIRIIEMKEFLKNNPNFSFENSTNPLNTKVFGLNPALEVRRSRITNRLKHRLENGLIEEVEGLLHKGVKTEKLIFYGLEYKFVMAFLQNEISKESLFEKLNVSIHQFAKRQMTYFRKMEKDGIQIHWLNSENPLEELLKNLD